MLAIEEHNKHRKAKVRQKSLQNWSKNTPHIIPKFRKSGRDGDNEDLYDKPQVLECKHDLEKDKVRHELPAIISTADGIFVSDVPLKSSRKRFKLKNSSMIEAFIDEQEQRHARLSKNPGSVT